MADVRLPALFSSNMVLQQGKPVPVWGWANQDEEVTVTFGDQKQTTKAGGNGRWEVKLTPLKASSTPAKLVVAGKNKIELDNVVVGEVWICSGQSNMEWSLRITHEPAAAIASASNPNIRLFTVTKTKANDPLPDVLEADWQVSSPESVPNFSAVAYYFGRDLQKALGVPVGLIHTSWGGSPAEVWIKDSVLRANDEYFNDILLKYGDTYKWQQAEVRKWDQEAELLRKEGKRMTRQRPSTAMWKPSELWNGMIAPLVPFAIKGAIWYQGESNAGRAEQYRHLFPAMIQNWRSDFGQGDFPFLFVQLAPWDKNRKRSIEEITATPGESDWAELREAQLLATKKVAKTGMAVITDYGDKDDIHPGKKEPVGARLALAARKIAYGQDVVHSGPIYKGMEVRGKEVVLSFDHIGGGLEAREGDLKSFAIAGPDKKFVWAKARLEGKDKVIVSADAVSEPTAVRYGWADFPVVNLFNKEGLPASPFRTDDFPMTTAKK
ncbi:MAG TPA: sialate O-acetylesterase [Methylomirabilota bacterium]|nr:sialate O-acetylesterase [Methylomirabilota bacterium]